MKYTKAGAAGDKHDNDHDDMFYISVVNEHRDAVILKVRDVLLSDG